MEKSMNHFVQVDHHQISGISSFSQEKEKEFEEKNHEFILMSIC